MKVKNYEQISCSNIQIRTTVISRDNHFSLL